MKFDLLKSIASGNAFQAELWVRSSIYCDNASDWRPLHDEDPLIFNVHMDGDNVTFTPTDKVRILLHDEAEYQFRPLRRDRR
jgi:hypothetical protein